MTKHKWILIDESRGDDCCYDCEMNDIPSGAVELFETSINNEKVRIGICFTCGANYSDSTTDDDDTNELVDSLTEKQRKYFEAERAKILEDIKKYPPEKRTVEN